MNIELDLIDLPEKDLRGSIDEDALEELADSLRDVGQLQPIGVMHKDFGRFEVVYGARRTRAAKLLGWKEIEAHVISDRNEETNAAKKLIENVQRENLTPIEEAYGLFQLIGTAEIDVRKLQRQTGKSREWIRTRLELIDAPEDVQAAIQAGAIGVGVARALSKIENPDVRQQYLSYAVENGCTEEQAKVWASQAQFAETGITTIEIHERTLEEQSHQPAGIDLQFTCFGCGTMHSHKRVNTLVFCSGCQDAISRARTQPQPHPE